VQISPKPNVLCAAAVPGPYASKKSKPESRPVGVLQQMRPPEQEPLSPRPHPATHLPHHHTISPAFNGNRQPTLRSRNLLTLRLTSRWDTQTGCPTAQRVTQTLECSRPRIYECAPGNDKPSLWPPCSLTDTWSMCDGRPASGPNSDARPRDCQVDSSTSRAIIQWGHQRIGFLLG
jgi:hypothetical protein